MIEVCRICQIVAVDKNNCIGKGNEMAWNIPLDFKYFKDTTKGHPIIMGRKTFESIGRPLPDRLNIVLTRNKSSIKNALKDDSVVVTDEISKAIEFAKKHDDYDTSKIFIIGGAEIYKASLDLTDLFYVTKVDTEVEGGDAFYPKLPENIELVSSTSAHDVFDLKFEVYSRK
jgi:dihydrofolate reductase